jgi:hypothetical protein
MRHTFQFKANGHPNIRSRHKTTIMTTTETRLSIRGDCIVVIGAETGLAQLPTEIKEAARDPQTQITFTIRIGRLEFSTKGKGHKNLTYADPKDMVARRSNYTCDRTLMVAADRAAIDVPEEIITALQSPESMITVQLTYERT